MSIIDIKNLVFGYQKKQTILRQLNMDVPAGSIYGFLGSNGAGKSTTIRTILGLLRPRSGTVNVFGQHIRSAGQQLYKNVGALIESPSLYPHLNARDHLRLACRYHQLDTNRISPLLEQVGLLHQQEKSTKKYSTGMKQRLGLAMAMIHDPDLLVLDEPTNGLDPQGISDIRDLLLHLKETGKTIILSSHLLAEIERIASQVGILKDGAMLFEGSINKLEQWKSQQQIWELRVNDPERARIIMADLASISAQENNLLLIKVATEAAVPQLIRQLVKAKIDVYELSKRKSDLEQLFMNVTKNEITVRKY
ncbi:MAG: ABC transporter ATP-binding protein [Bacteroidota bacterium]